MVRSPVHHRNEIHMTGDLAQKQIRRIPGHTPVDEKKMKIRTRMKVTVMTMMTVMACQFPTKKTISTTVRRHHCTIYHQ
eukprot:11907579-Prorocentrum_lima.AAC.1